MAEHTEIPKVPDERRVDTLRPFRHFCQRILPAVYDDSLSYYELLCKVTHYLNETMSNVNELNEAYNDLYEWCVQLQSWVDTYFDDLDIQEEIDNKLDQMAQDGTLEKIFGERYGVWYNVYPSMTKEELQSAINENDRVRFTPGRYEIELDADSESVGIGLTVDADGKSLWFDGSEIAIPGNCFDNYRIIQVVDCTDILLQGTGKIIGDKYTHLNTSGEWGHGISIIGASNVRVTGITVEKTHGDGIYVGNSQAGHSKNVIVDNVILYDNYRQGISVVSCQDCEISGCTISKTSGKAPAAGIDIEPNSANDVLTYVNVHDIVSTDNEGGMLVYANIYLDDVAVTIDNIEGTDGIRYICTKDNGIFNATNLKNRQLKYNSTFPIYMNNTGTSRVYIDMYNVNIAEPSDSVNNTLISLYPSSVGGSVANNIDIDFTSRGSEVNHLIYAVNTSGENVNMRLDVDNTVSSENVTIPSYINYTFQNTRKKVLSGNVGIGYLYNMYVLQSEASSNLNITANDAPSPDYGFMLVNNNNTYSVTLAVRNNKQIMTSSGNVSQFIVRPNSLGVVRFVKEAGIYIAELYGAQE